MNLKLIKPSIGMEEEYNNYINEWLDTEESIIPYSSRLLGRDYKTWLEDTYKIERKETCPPDLVPAHAYFLTEVNGKIIGAINIRHYLNDYLFNYGGHMVMGLDHLKEKRDMQLKCYLWHCLCQKN